MFVDFRDQPPPPPWQPRPIRQAPALTARQEKVLTTMIAVNLLLMIVAPIGGATVIQAIAALLR